VHAAREQPAFRRGNAGHPAKLHRHDPFLDTTLAGFSHVFIDKSVHDVSAEEREQTFEQLCKGPGFSLWLGNYKDILFDRAANDLLSDFVARNIPERVKDPRIADKLIPRFHGHGTRRVPLEARYFECCNQPNVHLVDLHETPIEAITETGLRTSASVHELGVIIYATGFDAILGSWNRIDIRGRGGKPLHEVWADGVKTWMGLGVTDFPSFWMLVGPQNGAIFCNIPRCSAIIVDWLHGLFRTIRASGAQVVEPTPDAAEKYTALCHKLLDLTLIGETRSWFTGINKNLDGRDRRGELVWIGGNPRYR
jgi:(2,2,3-trimethyl-5-oxocyclopent-3-enyl)acetyl-CoA 1,5-monooxygenase